MPNENQVQILLDAVNTATAEIRAVRQEMALVDESNKRSAATTDAASVAATRHKAALAAQATQLKNVGVAAQASMKGLAALRGGMLVIGGTVAPQFTGAMMVAVSSMQAARDVSGALNISFVRLATRLGVIAAAVGGGVWMWKEWKKASDEAELSSKNWGEQNTKQIKSVGEELRVLQNMGIVNEATELKISAPMLVGNSTGSLARLREFRAAMGIGDDGRAGLRRELQAEMLEGSAQELAQVDLMVSKRLEEIETLDRKVKLTREESMEMRAMVEAIAQISADRIKAAQAEEDAARAFQIRQQGAGLAADLAAAQARSAADPVFGVNPDAAAQADLAGELLAHNGRLNMIAELGLKEAEARGFREAAEAIHSARLIEIERQTSEARKQLLLAYVDSTASSFAQIADAAKQYGKEGFAMYKAFAMAEAIISTYSSAIKAYSSVVGVPYVGPVLAPIAAGAAIAAGVANVAQIAAATPGYATGGVVPGAYNGKDDRLIAVGPGEVVLTPKQARMIGMENIYAALAATGGKIPNRLGPASQAGHFNTGGLVTSAAGLGSVTNFNVGLISSRQEEREFQIRQGTRIMLRELEQRRVRR